MGAVKKNIRSIPIDEIKGIDIMFGGQMKLDVRNIPDKFKPFFDKTRKDSFETLKLDGIFESYEVEEIKDHQIRLCSGEVLESPMLARAFRQSSELVFYVVSVSGYEALDDAEENMIQKLFLDSWGTAVVECGSLYLKESLAAELEKQGVYSTFAFSPGQHNIAMELQKIIFRLLEPEAIGVTLNNYCLMHPKKSVSGIFGIGQERYDEKIRPCDFCDHRETCSSAYGGHKK
ncbi:hypothetical protein [Sinanaerobacter chloroacetimidivorans]|uniref:Uncharacterized protein n=1 Tax=Sinanaerobacter chloroacetimidivorans TaxID=2818044 RepID=A0A8J8B0A0_9FIRM|nr:hypothetical protein [Sinanaerobacter chloroacetimidivorans]MBR0597368.1 hypothetical protein [Sinanaerobacter chloroacetimidivorans]